MSKNPRFENTLEEMTYYKNLSELTYSAIMEYGNIYDIADKIRLCGTVFTVDSEDSITSANFCRQRICPMCQRRKSLKTYSDISRLVEHLNNRSWLHIVLTIRNCEQKLLSDTITRLFKRSSKLFASPEFKKAFHGELRCLEVTYNYDNDTFHPHLHILATADKSYKNNRRKYISRKKLQELWKSYAELDYTPQVHIDTNIDDNVVAEIAKYSVKPLQLDLPLQDRASVIEQLYETLYGRRLLQSYGEIRKALHDLKINLEADDNTNTNNPEHMFVYDFNLSQYHRKD